MSDNLKPATPLPSIQNQRKRLKQLEKKIADIFPKAESGEQFAEVCRLEAEMVDLLHPTMGRRQAQIEVQRRVMARCA